MVNVLWQWWCVEPFDFFWIKIEVKLFQDTYQCGFSKFTLISDQVELQPEPNY